MSLSTLKTVSDRIAALRKFLEHKNLDAWIVTGTDPHDSEYLPLHWQTRRWISGFTGSAGTFVVTRDGAALWTDGRYWLQAQGELEGTGILLMKEGLTETPSLSQWLGSRIPLGSTVGIDGETLTQGRWETLAGSLAGVDVTLLPQKDLLESIWMDRSPIVSAPIFDFIALVPQASRGERLTLVRSQLQALGADSLWISALEEVAWLSGLRGADIPYNPLFYGYLALSPQECVLFCNLSSLPQGLTQTLELEGLVVKNQAEAQTYLQNWNPGRLLVPADKTSWSLAQQLRGRAQSILYLPSPIARLKALKTPQEQNHIRRAMLQDGVAMVSFLHELELTLSRARNGEIAWPTEASAANRLRELRAQQPGFLSESFSPIPGWKDHGAIVHYECTPASDRPLEGDGLFLLDSGAQYLWGTTDITRTLGLGQPTAEEKRAFTLVLKAHIGLALAHFPPGTRGYQLDTLARNVLWQEGLNYAHGTGHGVGFCLGVHEGPQRINGEPVNVALEPGMVISNEPGYYQTGAFGVRLENLVLVVPSLRTPGWLQFETLTLCPIDTRLILTQLLTEREMEWLTEYHVRVVKSLREDLSEDEGTWLKEYILK